MPRALCRVSEVGTCQAKESNSLVAPCGEKDCCGLDEVCDFDTSKSCPSITDESTCVTSADGRTGQSFSDSPCTWCCGDACTSNKNKCEPHLWLEGEGSWTKRGKNGAGFDECGDDSSNNNGSSKKSKQASLIIIIPVVVAAVLLLAAILFLVRKRVVAARQHRRESMPTVGGDDEAEVEA